MIQWKEALNLDIIYARSLYVKGLLKYQVLNLLVHFCTNKYLTRGALGKFDGEVIRVISLASSSGIFVNNDYMSKLAREGVLHR